MMCMTNLQHARHEIGRFCTDHSFPRSTKKSPELQCLFKSILVSEILYSLVMQHEVSYHFLLSIKILWNLTCSSSRVNTQSTNIAKRHLCITVNFEQYNYSNAYRSYNIDPRIFLWIINNCLGNTNGWWFVFTGTENLTKKIKLCLARIQLLKFPNANFHIEM